ncbi:hypothetical protein PRIPAC_96433 [Pristionchus pacificus]|uniref:Uncharacterized protein n=1 Tax=Pristionchus pacificus TaxID=54126 RepID=A0A2A6D2W7_PRIPA|nr:hypothetical protein PRIPAC_96433 [Pristionchus pacificus]|eukprot:PDM84631.1 hypothetical protein PRIPAC_33654 [Pristionchus pacificus]
MIACGSVGTAAISSTSIKCKDDFQVIIVDTDPATGMANAAYVVYETVCMNGVWYSKDSAAGTPQILDPTNTLRAPVRVACAFFK